MKSIFALTVLSLLLLSNAYCLLDQKVLFKADSLNITPFDQLLDSYFDIKNALVNSDPSVASSGAGKFVIAIQKINSNSLTESEHKIFLQLQDTLTADAETISRSNNLTKQRDYFATLSDNLYLLAKEVKLTTKPIYRDYCPMKKKYWLSDKSAIKNPYFGKAMATCGSIKETLK